MKKLELEKIDNFMLNEKKYRNAHYEYLTTFAYLEMLISYCISSHYCQQNEKKMTFTTSFLSSLNRPKLFEEFLSVLDKNKISISQNLDEFNKLNNLRNDFAHSYFVPKKPNMKNGFCVTKIYSKSEMSSIEGFTKNNSDEEYLIKYSNLEKLTGEVYEIMRLNFKND